MAALRKLGLHILMETMKAAHAAATSREAREVGTELGAARPVDEALPSSKVTCETSFPHLQGNRIISDPYFHHP